MTLREHITELRNRLLKCVLAIVVGTVVGWIFYDHLLDFLMQIRSRRASRSWPPRGAEAAAHLPGRR